MVILANRIQLEYGLDPMCIGVRRRPRSTPSSARVRAAASSTPSLAKACGAAGAPSSPVKIARDIENFRVARSVQAAVEPAEIALDRALDGSLERKSVVTNDALLTAAMKAGIAAGFGQAETMAMLLRSEEIQERARGQAIWIDEA